MPSGSHSGSFGSHSSGGSSFGGTHNGGGSHSSPGRFGHGTFIFFGRSYSIRSSRTNLFIILAFTFLFLGIFSALIAASSKSSINKIETDYRYYQNMIGYAENHPTYLTNAKVSGRFFNRNANKWYITYEFDTTDGRNITVEGYTFSIYSEDEAYAFHINDEIEIAVDSDPITTNTDSIPTDYKNISLNKDGEYVNAKRSLTLSRVGYILLFPSCIACIILSVIIEIKAKRKQEIEEKQKQAFPKTKICPYCGNETSGDETKCLSCGANLKTV